MCCLSSFSVSFHEESWKMALSFPSSLQQQLAEVFHVPGRWAQYPKGRPVPLGPVHTWASCSGSWLVLQNKFQGKLFPVACIQSVRYWHTAPANLHGKEDTGHFSVSPEVYSSSHPVNISSPLDNHVLIAFSILYRGAIHK